MAFRDYFILFLFSILSLCFLTTTTQGQGTGTNNVIFYFKNDLPNNTLGPLTFSCFDDKKPVKINVNVLFSHDYLHFDKLICNASWGQLFTSFDAYNVPPGDDPAQYKTTYCNAREDGIYHSFYRHEEKKLIATWKHK
jgi:hypothetical protein